jgi:DNA-binding response OmpR family regulator
MSTPLLLCIDDDRLVLECVTWILEKHGYRTLAASSGWAGIRLFMEHAVDLVIVDQNMPGMNGREVTEELRRLKSGIPIIMSSGSDIPACAAALVDACIPKGVEFDSLLAAISNLLPFQQNGHSRSTSMQNLSDSES